jgi:D-xylose transport system substrate-binding protein
VNKKTTWALVACIIAALAVTACGSSKKKSSSSSTSSSTTAKTTGNTSGKVQVGVLLPDTKSSKRWESTDRPELNKVLAAAGLTHTVVNAQGDPATQRTQADQALTNGAKVIMLVDLDPGSGAAIIKAAHAKGAKVIDYDRLTLGGGADYYVSYDNAKVGGLQGHGLVKCMTAAGTSKPVIAELNGSPTDNNATLFAQGYNAVLKPKYTSGAYVKGPNQSVPDWDNQKALTIYEGMLSSTKNKIDGVLAANDGLANSVISAEGSHKLKPVPVTGQDATAAGLQHILAGQQCMTVFKSSKLEADAAAAIATALIKGTTPATTSQVDNGPGKKTPAVLLPPVSITKDNIDTVLKGGEVTRGEVCTGTYAKDCTKAGI